MNYKTSPSRVAGTLLTRALPALELTLGLMIGVAMPLPTLAASSDVQLWGFAAAAYSVTDKTDAAVEISPRFRETARGGTLVQGRGTITTKIAEHTQIGGGAAYADFAGGNEARLFQDVTFSTNAFSSGVFAGGTLAFRTRMEERFFANADRMALRAQQRVQLTVPLDKATRISGAGELLYILRTPDDGGQSRVDNWRARVHVGHRLGQHFEVGAAYLLMFSPRPGKNQWSHVPQLTLTFRP